MIRLDNISKTFRDGDTQVQALKNISFEVNKGDLVAIIGKSGSGKSTLLNILGLLDKQTDGDYYIDGKKVSSIPEREKAKLRNSHIGFVMQDFALVEKYTVKQNINIPLIYTDKPINKEKAINDVLKSVGLSDKTNTPAYKLSGGQKRRVAVAGVMAMKPRILVLDEPAAGLDPEGRDDILSEVKEYHKKTGTTVLLVSHSMEDIAKYANRVLVMSNKKIAMYDTVEKVFARAPELLELGLSVPQVTKIFLKLREMGVDVPADVYTIPYAVKTLLEAKRRRDAGESLVLPRSAARKGGAV